MTTTESQRTGCAGYTPEVDDPMRLWLESNDVGMDNIPMWPEIELREGQMRIERMARWDDEYQHKMLDRPYVYMGPWFDLKVPMPDGLWETYLRNRGKMAVQRAMTQLGRAGATVVHLHDGDGLMFVTADRNLEPETVNSMSIQLEALLPGVKVTIVAGVDTVMHRPSSAK